MSFYRAVEATSVTPFSPRALDRALAATLVAAARHVEPDLTRNDYAPRIASNPAAYARVRAIVEEKMITAGLTRIEIDRCLSRLNELRLKWEQIADQQTRNGERFVYSKDEPVKRLLQEPLGATRGNDVFIAARSMRDTEPVALLKLRKPNGMPF